VTRLCNAVGLVVKPEVFLDFLEVFALGGFLIWQLRPGASELTHASRLRLGAWSRSHPAAMGRNGNRRPKASRRSP
jgi:hypothetical protein